jgi:hypothetical protein
LGHIDDTITSSTNPTVVPGTGSEALCFIYQKADGTYELVAVNVESFLQESEFKDGLQVDSSTHEVSVKADNSGEFLSVGTNGVKVSGVSTAISAAIAALDATPSQAAGTDGLALSLTEVDGIVTAISGSIAAGTYDAAGAAANVLGNSNDTSSDTTVYGAIALANEALSAAEDAASAASGTVYWEVIDAPAPEPEPGE